MAVDRNEFLRLIGTLGANPQRPRLRAAPLEPIRNAVTGDRIRCVECQMEWAVYEGTQKCHSCSACVMCFLRPMASDGPNARFRRCGMCVCGDCGRATTMFRKDGDTNAQGYCQGCFAARYPESICSICRRSAATVLTRGQRTATVCTGCATRLVPGVFVSCFFCNGRSVNAWIKFAVCDFHATVRACGQEGCNPGGQCRDCRVTDDGDRTTRDARREARRVAPPHTGHPVGNYADRTCGGCIYRRERGVLLPAPTNPQFWPEWRDTNTAPPVLPMSKRRANRSSRYLGVEIEVAGVTDWDTAWRVGDVAERWGAYVVRDASLGNERAFEVVTSPAAGDFFVEQVQQVTAALNDSGAYVDRRCGLHVHVNAKDFSYYDMRRLLMLYSRLEPALLRTQPISRTYEGRYARPCGHKYVNGIVALRQPKQAKKEMVAAVYGADTVRPLRHRNGHNREVEARYDALNVQSWFYRGTVECRLHSGTVSMRKVVAWGSLWAALVDAAYRMTERSIMSLGTDVRSSVDTLMLLSPNDSVRRYIQQRLDLYGSRYDRMDEDQREPMEEEFTAREEFFEEDDE